MSEGLLIALGEADANMYLCSEDVRPGETFQISAMYYYSFEVKFYQFSAVMGKS